MKTRDELAEMLFERVYRPFLEKLWNSDFPPRAHDDVVNATAGALTFAASGGGYADVCISVWSDTLRRHVDSDEELSPEEKPQVRLFGY